MDGGVNAGRTGRLQILPRRVSSPSLPSSVGVSRGISRPCTSEKAPTVFMKLAGRRGRAPLLSSVSLSSERASERTSNEGSAWETRRD